MFLRAVMHLQSSADYLSGVEELFLIFEKKKKVNTHVNETMF